MKRLLALLLMAMTCHAYATDFDDNFEVIGTQAVDDDKGVQFLADVAGAVRVGWDFHPTDDEATPLYKFKNLTYFLQNGKRLSGYVANITIVNCHDKTSLQGPIWYAPTDEATPMMMPPKNFDFMPINKADVFYPVAQRLCQWSKDD